MSADIAQMKGRMTIPKNFISLFTGAGGLDVGFMAEGWEPALMVDNWKPAVETLRANHDSRSDRIHGLDMAALAYGVFDKALSAAGFRHEDIGCITGGPPCQPFSRLNQAELFGKCGKDGKPLPRAKNLNDPRRSLFVDFLRIVDHVKPPLVVMENVFDLKTRKMGGRGSRQNDRILDIILYEFDKTGYHVVADILNAKNHCVPQMRRRMIFIGVRKDLGIIPSLPPPQSLTTSVRDEFARIRAHHPNQETKVHAPAWRERVRHIPSGGYYNDLPLEHKVLKPVDFAFVRKYEGQVRHYCFRHNGAWREFRVACDRKSALMDGELLSLRKLRKIAGDAELFRIMPRMGTYLRRIRWDISHTVTRNPLIHPEENRELTVREKAAIQTFPPDYRFCGSRQEQHVLVGNAVPCSLGRAIASHIGRII